MGIEDDHDDDDIINENASFNEERIGEILTRIEHDLAYSSDKVSNLEMLLMQVAGRANDFEAQATDYQDISSHSLAKAFEFDALSVILNSEVVQLDSFMDSLQMEIVDARRKLSQYNCSDESTTEIEGKLCDAEEYLKKLQDLVADIRTQSDNLERTLALGEQEAWITGDKETGNGHLPSMTAEWKLHTVEQQRHVLQTLEKSLAREMDLEKKLSDSRYNEEELKMKVHYEEQEAYCMEESIQILLVRVFEAENASELLLGISKELSGKLQIVQFNLNGSIRRGNEMKSKLEEIMIKLSTKEVALDKLKMQHSELSDLDNAIEGLRENALKTEIRAESAEAKCALLTRTNMELNEELGVLRNNGTEKAIFLEKKLEESETQLEHARVSAEASEEQQNMLFSTLNDMENVIEDLKRNVSKAESRAESAESKCTLLTETNLELNEELDFLRGRLDCLETSLHQADDAKVATTKDIGIRTTIITNLVTKLALERERLQLQISALAKKNKILTEKCLKVKDNAPTSMNQAGTDIGKDSRILKPSEEVFTEFSTTSFQVEKSSDTTAPVCEIGLETAVSSSEGSELETVRTIGATQLNVKYFLMALTVALVSATIYLFQLDNRYDD